MTAAGGTQDPEASVEHTESAALPSGLCSLVSWAQQGLLPTTGWVCHRQGRGPGEEGEDPSG